jgi:hypothetical protein
MVSYSSLTSASFVISTHSRRIWNSSAVCLLSTTTR